MDTLIGLEQLVKCAIDFARANICLSRIIPSSPFLFLFSKFRLDTVVKNSNWVFVSPTIFRDRGGTRKEREWRLGVKKSIVFFLWLPLSEINFNKQRKIGGYLMDLISLPTLFNKSVNDGVTSALKHFLTISRV